MPLNPLVRHFPQLPAWNLHTDDNVMRQKAKCHFPGSDELIFEVFSGTEWQSPEERRP